MVRAFVYCCKVLSFVLLCGRWWCYWCYCVVVGAIGAIVLLLLVVVVLLC